jgi:hypothetical protein
MKRNSTDEKQIERIIPAEASDFAEPRNVRYSKPFVLPSGKTIDLNEPGPLSEPNGNP